jgi:hypothetical protein
MKYTLLSICLLLAFSPPGSTLHSCQTGSNSGKPLTKTVTKTVTMTRLRTCLPLPCPFSSTSGLDDPLRVMIRDRKAWREMWERIHRRGPSPEPELPEINFSKEMLVVVALGSRPTGGYAIFIEGVYERDGRLEVKVSSQSAGKNCMVTQSVTQPIDIVRIPKADIPMAFLENQVVHECK